MLKYEGYLDQMKQMSHKIWFCKLFFDSTQVSSKDRPLTDSIGQHVFFEKIRETATFWLLIPLKSFENYLLE